MIRLGKLLEGENDGEYDSAAQLIERLWVDDSKSFEHTLAELLRIRPSRPELLDEIAVASRAVADSRFEDVLFSITKNRGIAPYAKQMLSMFLVSVGHPGAIAKFDASFGSVCDRFLKGKVDAQAFGVTVRQACMLKRSHLHSVLGETLACWRELDTRSHVFTFSTAR